MKFMDSMLLLPTGSTNSGNTDQLGNKITTGISHQLKNQAINKTEKSIKRKCD
jgi:hypothetical protein